MNMKHIIWHVFRILLWIFCYLIFHGIDFKLFHFTSFECCVCESVFCSFRSSSTLHKEHKTNCHVSIENYSLSYTCTHTYNALSVLRLYVLHFYFCSFVIKCFKLKTRNQKIFYSKSECYRASARTSEKKASSVFHLIDSFVQQKKSIYFKITLLFFKSNVQSAHKKQFTVWFRHKHTTLRMHCSFWEMFMILINDSDWALRERLLARLRLFSLEL